MNSELHVYEEPTHLFWGLIILVCTAMGTYMLAGSFISGQWDISQLDQLLALGLFLISFRGIFKLSEPLYHFVFTFEGDHLLIHTYKGELHISTRRIPVQEISELKFSPNSARSPEEALFDYSTSYLLMWKRLNHSDYQKLLDVESAHFTLKVEDVSKIIRFIRNKNPNITVPAEQAGIFNL